MRSGVTLATAAKPASSQVRRALWSGLTRTSVNVIPSSRARSLRALPRPARSRGYRSVPRAGRQRPRSLAVAGQINSGSDSFKVCSSSRFFGWRRSQVENAGRGRLRRRRTCMLQLAQRMVSRRTPATDRPIAKNRTGPISTSGSSISVCHRTRRFLRTK